MPIAYPRIPRQGGSRYKDTYGNPVGDVSELFFLEQVSYVKKVIEDYTSLTGEEYWKGFRAPVQSMLRVLHEPVSEWLLELAGQFDRGHLAEIETYLKDAKQWRGVVRRHRAMISRIRHVYGVDPADTTRPADYTAPEWSVHLALAFPEEMKTLNSVGILSRDTQEGDRLVRTRSQGRSYGQMNRKNRFIPVDQAMSMQFDASNPEHQKYLWGVRVKPQGGISGNDL